MNYFTFDSLCFNISNSEQVIILMISAKSEHKDFKEFINRAVERLYEENLCNIGIALSELKAQIINIPISNQDKQCMFQIIEGMNERVHIQFEEIENIITVFESEWNDCTYAFETKNCRYYLNWMTTA